MAKTTNYQRGVRYEYIAKKALEQDGWIVFRSAGSHGIFDLSCIHPELGEAMFLQIKATKGGERAVARLIKEFKRSMPVPQATHFTQGIWVWSKGKWHIWVD